MFLYKLFVLFLGVEGESWQKVNNDDKVGRICIRTDDPVDMLASVLQDNARSSHELESD